MLREAFGDVGRHALLIEVDQPQRRLAAWSSQNGVPFIDLLPDFRQAGAQQVLYFPHDGHWNPAGHALAGKLIRADLVRLSLLQP